MSDATATHDALQELVDGLGIGQWDAILVGDGSGSRWGYPVGWGTVMWDKAWIEPKIFFGSFNEGTVNIAEIMAYVHPLLWYVATVRDRKQQDYTPKHVHVVTDSEYVTTVGGGRSPALRRNNQMLWGALELVKRQAIVLHWHWAAREQMTYNRYADYLSKAARAQAKGGTALTDLSHLAKHASGADPVAEKED